MTQLKLSNAAQAGRNAESCVRDVKGGFEEYRDLLREVAAI